VSTSPIHDLQSRLQSVCPRINQSSLFEGAHFGELRQVLQLIAKAAEQGETGMRLAGLQFDSTLIELERRQITIEPCETGVFQLCWLPSFDLSNCVSDRSLVMTVHLDQHDVLWEVKHEGWSGEPKPTFKFP